MKQHKMYPISFKDDWLNKPRTWRHELPHFLKLLDSLNHQKLTEEWSFEVILQNSSTHTRNLSKYIKTCSNRKMVAEANSNICHLRLAW